MLHALFLGALSFGARVFTGPPGAKSFSARPRIELEETPESLQRRRDLAASQQQRSEARLDGAGERIATAEAKRERRRARNAAQGRN